MLLLPTKGFGHSVQKHNIQLDVMCDWIEGSVLFDDEELSVAEIADVLIEEKIYDQQNFAFERVRGAWEELRKRSSWIGGNFALDLKNDWIQIRKEWRYAPAQAFCILLSIAPCYDWWVSEFGKDYNEQGELFELLTKESIKAQFSDWEIYQTGWSRTNSQGLKQIATDVSALLGEDLGDLALWDDPNAKELGLDLLCYRPFPDNRRGIPVYLMQCASGGNWKSKRHTPDLNVWQDVIRFKNQPVKAFSAPFSFLSVNNLAIFCIASNK